MGSRVRPYSAPSGGSAHTVPQLKDGRRRVGDQEHEDGAIRSNILGKWNPNDRLFLAVLVTNRKEKGYGK